MKGNLSPSNGGLYPAEWTGAVSDLKETPSGPLYAVLMGKCSLDTYNGLLDIMVKMGLISIKGHVITWIEPTDKTSKAYQMVAGIRQVYAKQTA